MSELTIEPVLCLKDNYAYLVYDRSSGFCAVVDPSEAIPVAEALAARKLTLTHILNTHHHKDLVGGNLELKTSTGARIIGPGKDRERIPGIDDGAKGLARHISNASADIVPGRRGAGGDRHAIYVAGTLAGSPDGPGAVGVAYDATVLSIRADSEDVCAKACA